MPTAVPVVCSTRRLFKLAYAVPPDPISFDVFGPDEGRQTTAAAVHDTGERCVAMVHHLSHDRRISVYCHVRTLTYELCPDDRKEQPKDPSFLGLLRIINSCPKTKAIDIFAARDPGKEEVTQYQCNTEYEPTMSPTARCPRKVPADRSPPPGWRAGGSRRILEPPPPCLVTCPPRRRRERPTQAVHGLVLRPLRPTRGETPSFDVSRSRELLPLAGSSVSPIPDTARVPRRLTAAVAMLLTSSSQLTLPTTPDLVW